jgi:hypothetical protein
MNFAPLSGLIDFKNLTGLKSEQPTQPIALETAQKHEDKGMMMTVEVVR